MKPIGAVAYINMFPFFGCNEDVELFATPRLLNGAAQEGVVSAACMSAIAGIRNGFQPVRPFMGVAAKNKVTSVYVEPEMRDKSDELFWGEFFEKIDSSGPGTGAKPPALREKTVIVSSGASEQSEWMIFTLLRSQGFPVRTMYVGNASRVEEVSKDLRKLGQERVLRLYIGDPALERIWLTSTNLVRWDMAYLWKKFTKLPAIFAVWYKTKPEMEECGELIYQSLQKWQQISEDERIRKVIKFLQNQKNSLPRQFSVPQIEKKLGDYLSNLSFILDNEFQMAFEGYQHLHRQLSI